MPIGAQLPSCAPAPDTVSDANTTDGELAEW